MSGSLSSFLLDTLMWTGGLIALVLVLRRPVARHFGAQAAYALWFLPLFRLALPPLVLPAWLKPAEEAAMPGIEAAVEAAPAMLPVTGYETLSAGPVAVGSPVDFTTPLLALWLAGAAVFLVHRFRLYFRLRRELLEDARPVGEAGRIRLVETPAIAGPMALGVTDKVVALPVGFMAATDRQGRDLALAHELAHHKGHDLLVNFLVQPLFALHWFNPLGHIGWNALRRDQEAACDVRVVTTRSREERAAYAGIIADFARRSAGAPRAALAAPMACPVLGDKSIIHRLRSLSMTDISPRRRLGARLTFAAALLALPLTASISYAESTQDAPLPPEAPLSPVAPLAPQAALTPAAPLPPEAIDPDREHVDGDHRVLVRRVVREGEAPRVAHRVMRRDGREMTAEERAEFERDMAEMREELHRELGENGEMRREMRIAMAEAHAEANAAARAAAHAAPRVVMKCKDKDRPVTSETDEHGRTTMFVCESYGDRVALKSLKRARDGIAHDTHMSAEVRAEVLSSLDAEIARLSE